MYYIFLLIFIIATSGSNEALTSDELGVLFYKHMTESLLHTELQEIEDVLKDFVPFWDIQSERRAGEITKDAPCFICRGIFKALILAVHKGIPDKYITGSAIKLCTIATGMPKVCQGILHLNYPILKYIIKNTPEAHPHTFCGLILQKNQVDYCPLQDKRFKWKVDIPPKTIHENKILDNRQNLTIALISDVHIDPLYYPSSPSDCNEPACCRQSSSTKHDLNNDLDLKEIFKKSRLRESSFIFSDINNSSSQYINGKSKSNQAGYWGSDAKCDTPIWAYEDAIERIASHKDLEVVYYLGDNVNHFIWETTYENNTQIHKLVIEKMMKHFGKNVLVVPVTGNHESQPASQFAPPSVQEEGLNTTWLYKKLAEQWKPYLSKEAFESMRKDGQYSMLISPGLRAISLNNIVAYKFNWWLVHDPLNAKRHLEWLINELHKAELAGEKVHILSHIPPGDGDLMYTWTKEYKKVIERFSSTITAQFSGHTHLDDMRLFLSDKSEEPFSTAWGAGSLTNFDSGSNRNYKIVNLDDNSIPKNIECYIYNLTEANLTPNKKPRWYKLYDMKNTYEIPNLSPNSINNLTYSMVTSKKRLLDTYSVLSTKASDVSPFCDVNCELEKLCRVVTTVLWERNRCETLKKLYFS